MSAKSSLCTAPLCVPTSSRQSPNRLTLSLGAQVTITRRGRLVSGLAIVLSVTTAMSLIVEMIRNTARVWPSNGTLA
jgi:hypothetical protein